MKVQSYKIMDHQIVIGTDPQRHCGGGNINTYYVRSVKRVHIEQIQ